MKISNIDISEALNVIKNVCQQHDCCLDCPLRYEENSNMCFLNADDEAPSEWDLNDVENWRAFK